MHVLEAVAAATWHEGRATLAAGYPCHRHPRRARLHLIRRWQRPRQDGPTPRQCLRHLPQCLTRTIRSLLRTTRRRILTDPCHRYPILPMPLIQLLRSAIPHMASTHSLPIRTHRHRITITRAIRHSCYRQALLHRTFLPSSSIQLPQEAIRSTLHPVVALSGHLRHD